MVVNGESFTRELHAFDPQSAEHTPLSDRQSHQTGVAVQLTLFQIFRQWQLWERGHLLAVASRGLRLRAFISGGGEQPQDALSLRPLGLSLLCTSIHCYIIRLRNISLGTILPDQRKGPVT